MAQPTDVANVCCVAIELSKSSWVIAFSPPADGGRACVHQVAARDINRLLSFLESARAKAEHEASRPLEIVVCYEVGYDGFWLARLLIAKGIRTIVFDPASFLMPRKGRRAKTDRLDAEGMTRTLRACSPILPTTGRDCCITGISCSARSSPTCSFRSKFLRRSAAKR
jgi:transposase